MPEAVTEQEFRFLGEMGRYDAFLRLYRSEAPEDAAVLSGMLASPDPLVPLILLQYLEDMADKKAVLAILRLVEDGNDFVSRAAMESYSRNHFPGKARLLKQLLVSRHPRACRFAVRTLSRAGFMEALPLIVRELPERDGEVQAEMIEALRFLPDKRSVAVVMPFTASRDEHTRFIALQVLSELQHRERVLPPAFFMRFVQDPSERVRRLCLEALHRMPTRQVSQMFLKQALRKEESEPDRERAIRALAAFPSQDWVAPLLGLLAGRESPGVRMAAEISLKALPADLRRDGLLAVLDRGGPGIRHRAALLLAELHGGEPPVRSRLLRLWSEADEATALDQIGRAHV